MKMLLLIALLVGCSINQRMPKIEEEKPTTIDPSPTPEKVLSLAWRNQERTKYLVDAINSYGENLLSITPKDHKDFVETYPRTFNGVIEFWARILVTMAKYESSWKSATKYEENFKSSYTKKNVVSRGLFQISVGSSRQKRYSTDGQTVGGCGFTKGEQLHDDRNNIECSVKIFNRLFGENQRIAGKVKGAWQGPARYWSVLRGTTTHTKKALKAIKRANK